jgi:8-oxo-dGTP diphosphatase
VNYNLIILFNRNLNKVLLIKRNKEPYKGKYNGVGGKINDKKELPIEAAYREMFEEVGLSARQTSLKMLLTLNYTTNSTLYVYYGIVDDRVEKKCDEGTLTWFPIVFLSNVFDNRFAGEGNLQYFISASLHDLGAI